MTKRRPLATLLALWIGLAATSAQAAQSVQVVRPCLTATDAEGLVLVLAPDIFKAVGISCAQVLPPEALIRQPSGPFLAKYQAAADDAWPKGKLAIARIAGPEVAGILDSELARPLVTTMMVPLLTKDLKPRDCPAIDRMVTLMAPLPPRNVAAILVTIVQLSNDDRAARGQKQSLPVCPLTAGR